MEHGTGRGRALEGPGSAANAETLRPSLAKETRKCREGTRERKEEIPAVSCVRGNSGREERGQERGVGKTRRHALKIDVRRKKGRRQGAGKGIRSKGRACGMERLPLSTTREKPIARWRWRK